LATTVAQTRASRKAGPSEKSKLARITKGEIITVARKRIAAAKTNLGIKLMGNVNSLLLYDNVPERSQIEFR
jgi:hypothetical protein